MSRIFEQIINSMSDIEFDRLIDSVKELREVSTPVNSYKLIYPEDNTENYVV